MEPYVPQKVQEAIFNQILDRPENKVCADCPNKSPTWASIDFGVFVCLRCSGAHRHLSPVVTRVRSAKIDDWKMEQIEILAAVGNKIGNDYWECNLPSSFKKPDISTSLEDVLEMVKNKYIKAMYAPKDRINPVKEFLEARTDGQTTAGSFNQAKKGQNTTQTTEKKIPTQNQNLIDFEDDDGFGEFKSAPEKSVKKDIPKPDVEVKFVSNNETTQKSGIDLWDTSFEKKSSNVNQQKVSSLDPFSFEQPQNTLRNPTQKSNSVSTDSSKLYELYKTGNPEQQNSNKPVNGTNFTGGQSNYAFLDGLGSQNQQNRFVQQQQQQSFGFQNGMNGQSAKTQNYGGAQSQAGTYGSQTSMNNPTGGFSFGGSNNSFSSNSFGGVNNGGYGSSGFNSLSNSGFNSGIGKQQQQPFSFNQPTTAPFSFNTVNATQTLSQPTSVKTGFSFV